MAQILVVDDEIGIRELMSEILSDEGHTVHLAENATAAREWRARTRPDLVLLDIWMPDSDGVTLLKEWASGGLLTMPVVMMSGHATIDTAVEATRIGALDFLEKPIALQRLLATVKKALSQQEHRPGSGLLAELGRSAALIDLKRRLAQLAAQDAPLMLRGEPGMQPELFARLAHRPGTPWVAACQALADGEQDILQQAAGGVLFFDDLMHLSAAEQKHLAFIVPRAARARARLISFVSEAPGKLAEMGFDTALVATLAELKIALPPLRELREDIASLAQAMLAQQAESRAVAAEATPGAAPAAAGMGTAAGAATGAATGAVARRFSPEALEALTAAEWRGNLDELSSAVRTLAATASGDEISAADVARVLEDIATPAPAPAFNMGFDQPLREARDAFERAYFEHHLLAEGGSIARVAEKSGLERTHLYRKLKALGINTGKRESDGWGN